MSLAAAFVVPAVTLILLAAAAHDLAARTIPNRLAVATALLGLMLRAVAGELGWGLLAAALVFGLAALAWRFGAMGGGDVKLLGAAALLVPPAAVPALVLAVALAGGVVALAYLMARHLAPGPAPGPVPREAWLPRRALRAEAWRIRRGAPLPYGVAIAGGTLATIAVSGA